MGIRALTGAVLALLAGPALAEPLRVCLDGQNPPFSDQKTGAGFDVAMSRAVASLLERELVPVWYDDARDNNRSAKQDVGALLAAERCDLVAGFPLTADAVAEPTAPTSRLPGYEGGPPPRKLPRVTLQQLAASVPYYRLGFLVVMRPGIDRPIRALGDLKGLKVGAPAATLAGALLLGYRHGALGLISLDSRAEALTELEEGRLDATLVEIGVWSRYRAAHPTTALTNTGFRPPIGFNTGFVALQSRPDVLASVDDALNAIHASGDAQRLADQAGLIWNPPAPPALAPRLTPPMLLSE